MSIVERTAAILDSVADRIEPSDEELVKLWSRYAALLRKSTPKPGDADKLADLCRALHVDRETLELHALAIGEYERFEPIAAALPDHEEEHRAAVAEIEEAIGCPLTIGMCVEGPLADRRRQASADVQEAKDAARQVGAIRECFGQLFGGKVPMDRAFSHARPYLPAAVRNAMRTRQDD